MIDVVLGVVFAAMTTTDDASSTTTKKFGLYGVRFPAIFRSNSNQSRTRSLKSPRRTWYKSYVNDEMTTAQKSHSVFGSRNNNTTTCVRVVARRRRQNHQPLRRCLFFGTLAWSLTIHLLQPSFKELFSRLV